MPQSEEAAIADSLTGESNQQLTPRERILLWVARARFGFDELDAYEFIPPEPALLAVADRTLAVDGLLVEAADLGHDITVLLYRSPLGRPRLQSEVHALSSLGGPTAVLRAIASQSAALASILQRAKVAPDDEQVRLRVAAVAPTSRLPSGALADSRSFEVEVLDRQSLANLANAVAEPGPVPGEQRVAVRPGEVIETAAGRYRVVVGVVSAQQIVSWPEIESRRLFDMNVRLGLGINRVRRSLDEAFSTADGQEEILAYHNGMTVLTDSLRVEEDSIFLDGISVVNGAQTLLALYENRDSLAPGLRLLVKFVEIKSALDDAQEIAIRSNSQNPVTSRNLRALEGTQLRLRRELVAHGFEFQTRTDRGRAASWTTLQNDVVAQWLCAIYLEEPWLAVKRTSLFLTENYARVFPPDLAPERVILAAHIRRRIEIAKAEFPDDYSRAWNLSALTACYLVGQIMRSSRDLSGLLLHPEKFSMESIDEALDEVVEVVVAVFREHADNAGSFNNYFVDFKSKQALLHMSALATRAWLVSERSR